MGRSKPRTNKRPPPKRPGPGNSPLDEPLPPPHPTSTTNPTNLPYLSSAPPPPTSLPPSHAHTHAHHHLSPSAPLPPTTQNSAFTSALHSWSTSALSRLDALPRLTPSQLSAIAGAAAGFSADPSAVLNGAGGLPIDLPGSLAALFEAKLTLDREKAKLMRMQRELKGYREGVKAVAGGEGGGGGGGMVQGGGRGGKGKEVMLDEGDEEVLELDGEDEVCTCGGAHGHAHYESDHHHHHHHHSHPHEHDHDHHHHDHHDHHDHDHEYYSDEGEEGSEYECYDCDCTCHYVECDHAEGEECDCEEVLPDEYEDELGHQHHHHHHGGHEYVNGGGGGGMNGGGGGGGATLQRLEDVQGMAGWDDEALSRKPLSEDPERLEEAVRELFNWIKAVVWTIEQAAIVAGRRNWAAQEAK